MPTTVYLLQRCGTGPQLPRLRRLPLPRGARSGGRLPDGLHPLGRVRGGGLPRPLRRRHRALLRPGRGPHPPRWIPRGLVARHHPVAHGALADPAALLAPLSGVSQV